MIKAVLDTNILISAIFWRGKEYKILNYGLNNKIRIVSSTEIINEVIEKLKVKFKFPEDKLQSFIDLMFTYFEIVETQTKVNIVRDQKDNKIIECAIDSIAEYIVSGDKDLLILKSYKNIKIVSSTEFINILQI